MKHPTHPTFLLIYTIKFLNLRVMCLSQSLICFVIVTHGKVGEWNALAHKHYHIQNIRRKSSNQRVGCLVGGWVAHLSNLRDSAHYILCNWDHYEIELSLFFVDSKKQTCNSCLLWIYLKKDNYVHKKYCNNKFEIFFLLDVCM